MNRRESLISVLSSALTILTTRLPVVTNTFGQTVASQPPAPSPSPTPTPPAKVLSKKSGVYLPTPEDEEKWEAGWLQIDWEREKHEKKIATDTVVIHHTAGAPGMTWQALSELQLNRLYVPVYNSESKDPYVKGTQPRSGHYRYNNQGVLVEIFYAYHAWVRQDKSVEQLLPIADVGWHAGKWAENMRALGLVFDGDFEKGDGPSDGLLQAAVNQVLEWKKILPLKFLKAHKEVNTRTSCPGEWWDRKDKNGKTGKEKLAALTGLQLIN
jgi:hypothetical protein